MVADAKQLALISSMNGFRLFRYDSLDAETLVRVDGYFNNNDDGLNMAVGDIVIVVDWTTTVRTGTIAGYHFHIVMAVGATGDVDLSDALDGVVTNAD